MPPPQGKDSRLLLNLQFLRFVAATMVVLLHGANYYEDMGGRNWLATLPRCFGFAGVDVFFVLSGFIIWTTNLRTETTPQIFRYLYRRLARIFLGYWPFFFFCWATRAWFFPERMTGVRPLWSFFLLPEDQAGQMLHVAWTLSFELLFYSLFFFVLFSSRRILVISVLTALSLAANVYNDYVLHIFREGNGRLIPPAARFLSAPVLLEFFLGCFVAHFVAKGWRRNATPALLAGLAVLVAGAAFKHHEMEPPPILYEALWGGGAALVIYGLVSLERDGLRILPRFSAIFGGASYTIYLSHTILYRIARGSGLVERVKDGAFPALVAYGLTILVILGFSALFYVWVENPLYGFAKRLIRRRAPTPALGAAAASAGSPAPPEPQVLSTADGAEREP